MTLLTITRALGDDARTAYGELADILIPADDQMPSATQVGVHTRWIDEALRLRADLRPAFDAAVDAHTIGTDAKATIIALASAQPDVFAALGTLTAGAYYFDDRVRELIGYPGQEARPVTDDTDDYLEMLANVVERGPVYRQAPA